MAGDSLPPVTTPASLTVAENAAATAIGIAAPTDPNYSAAQLSVTVTGLPNDGTVYLADGTTAVTSGETLTVAQLTGLTFQPIGEAFSQSSTFSYTVTDPSGLSATGSATLAIWPATSPPAPAVSWSGGSVSGTEGSPIALGTLSATVNGPAATATP